MKCGGSKAVRATRLREGLLRLKAETLAGIYNGKAFDDMSEFELRYSPISQPTITFIYIYVLVLILTCVLLSFMYSSIILTLTYPILSYPEKHSSMKVNLRMRQLS